MIQTRLVAREPRLTVISNGLGQDSSAVIYKLGLDARFRRRVAPGDVLAVHSDTGDEYPEVYQHRDRIATWCAGRGIPFVSLSPDSEWFSPSNRGGVVEKSRRYGTVPSVHHVRSCTPSFKTDPFYRFLAAHLRDEYAVGGSSIPATLSRFASRFGRVRILVGFTADEAGRVERTLKDHGRSAWMRDFLEMCFPLVELGWDRSACQEFIRRSGFEVPFASACATCFYQGDLRLAFLDRFYPDRAEDWARREEMKLAKFVHLGARNKGVFRKGTVRENLARARAAYAHVPDAQLYEMTRLAGHGVRSSY